MRQAFGLAERHGAGFPQTGNQFVFLRGRIPEDAQIPRVARCFYGLLCFALVDPIFDQSFIQDGQERVLGDAVEVKIRGRPILGVDATEQGVDFCGSVVDCQVADEFRHKRGGGKMQRGGRKANRTQRRGGCEGKQIASRSLAVGHCVES